ncbi:MAG: hypothetical protein QXG10_04685 [Candidatus Hadarchaeales archaeon]
MIDELEILCIKIAERCGAFTVAGIIMLFAGAGVFAIFGPIMREWFALLTVVIGMILVESGLALISISLISGAIFGEKISPQMRSGMIVGAGIVLGFGLLFSYSLINYAHYLMR